MLEVRAMSHPTCAWSAGVLHVSRGFISAHQSEKSDLPSSRHDFLFQQ